MSYWKADVRRWGRLRSAYIRVMRRVSRYLGFQIYHIGTYEMSRDPEIPCRLPGITFRQLSREDLHSACEVPDLELKRSFVDPALERGDIAFGAYDGDDLISYVWSSSSAAPHMQNVWVRLVPPRAYGYKALTLPEYRGNRIAPSVLLFANSQMIDAGYKYRTGYIATTNFANKQSGRFLGGWPEGYVGYFYVLGRAFTFRTPKARRIGFEFFQPHRE